MREKQTIISVAVALLLTVLALLNFQLAVWLGIAFLVVYVITKVLQRRKPHSNDNCGHWKRSRLPRHRLAARR